MKVKVKLLLYSIILNLTAYSQSYDSLSINNINAGFQISGDLFTTPNHQPHFEVPNGSGKHTFFSAGLWIGGLDAANQLHSAFSRPGQISDEFYPGPLSYMGDCDSVNYNRIWKLNRSSVDSFANGLSLNIPAWATEYPAHGNTQQGISYYLFPFYDSDSDGNYEPQDYDYPLIRGDEALLYIFNDDCNSWHQTGSESMGIEVRVMAYAFDCPEDSALNNTVFVHYDIINKSGITYYDTRIGLWSDLDIGFANDDFIASDVIRGAYYCYNGSDIDGSNSVPEHYGDYPPAQAVVFLDGPYQDNDNLDNNVGIGVNESLNGLGYGDGIVDNERLGMSSFVYHNNSPGVQGDPQTAEDYYNYMRSIWRDNTPMVYGGNGHINNCTSCESTSYMFPGDSDSLYWGTGGVPVNPWTEIDASNTPGDRRGLGSIGPFTLGPGDREPLDIAFVFGRSYSAGAEASVMTMKARIDAIREMFINDSIPAPCGGNFVPAPLAVKESIISSKVKIYPNPTSSELNVELPINEGEDWNFSLVDMTGKILESYTHQGHKNKIDVSGLVSGFYLLRISSPTETISKPFVKK